MSRDVRCVSPETPALEALEALHDARTPCLIVCEARRPVGILTEHDALRVAIEGLRARDPLPRVRDVMAFPVATLRASQSLEEALALVEERSPDYLPVVDERGELAGVLCRTELVREAANRRLEALALLDGLTGIRNRRALEQDLERLHAGYLRYARAYALALCDLDSFKQYNDGNGHLAGDDVLRSVARSLVEAMRSADAVYRYGGEEILVVLPETGLAEARLAAERIRASVESLAIPHERSPHRVVTISCGVAAAEPGAAEVADWQALVAAADAALYRAKNSGRNRVE